MEMENYINKFNKTDYKILHLLNKNGYNSSFNSLTIKKISDETKLSIPKIRMTLKIFVALEYIKEGAKEGISKTFFITDSGVSFLNKVMFNKDDVMDTIKIEEE